MPKVAVHMRLEESLVGRIDKFAESRLSNRTAVVQAACLAFLEAAGGGVPELEEASADGTQGGGLRPDEAHSHTDHYASATGAVTARGASRPAAPSQASVCKTHGRTANRPGGRCNLVGCMG
jgi:predicted transcriptional regulator